MTQKHPAMTMVVDLLSLSSCSIIDFTRGARRFSVTVVGKLLPHLLYTVLLSVPLIIISLV